MIWPRIPPPRRPPRTGALDGTAAREAGASARFRRRGRVVRLAARGSTRRGRRRARSRIHRISAGRADVADRVDQDRDRRGQQRDDPAAERLAEDLRPTTG